MKHLKNKSTRWGHFIFARHSLGFTLIELLIAMAVGMIVLGAVISVFTVQSRQLNKQDQIAEMQQNARIAMEMMSKDIMMAGFGPSSSSRCTGATPTTEPSSSPYSCLGIVVANANYISFSSNLSGTTQPSENITYSLYTSDGVQSLGRKLNSITPQPVVDNVQSLAFAYTYTDSSGTVQTTSERDKIRTIQISITTRTAQIDPDSGTYHTFTLTQKVSPRNLGTSGY